MQVRDAIEDYRYALLHHSPATQTWYRSRLNTFACWCEDVALHKDGRVLELEDITPTELRKYIHYLSTKPSQANGKEGKLLSSYTVHGHARTVRTFLNWCSREDVLDKLVSEKTPKRMSMPKIDQRVIETFTDEELVGLFAACNREYKEDIQIRDRAILSILIDTGVRASELCTLTLENVHLDPDDSFIKVVGKGRKEREVGLGTKARTILYKYIRRYRNATRTIPDTEQHVFISRHSKPLTVSGLNQLLYRLGAWAHVENVHAHKFRHTYACNYLLQGGDVFKLSRLLGHTSVQITTDVYLRAFKARDARQGGGSVLDRLS
jgi:site-specific recombinase XerD